MRSLDGIETAKLLRRKGMKGIIIFVTAYPDFVFQGYEVHAFHYILKPYRKEKIEEVLRQALHELDLSKEQYFVIEQKARVIRIPLSQTIAFQSDRRKVEALLEEDFVAFYGRIDEVYRELPSCFIRIHNRYIVNLNYVTTLERGPVHTGQPFLSGQQGLPAGTGNGLCQGNAEIKQGGKKYGQSNHHGKRRAAHKHGAVCGHVVFLLPYALLYPPSKRGTFL